MISLSTFLAEYKDRTDIQPEDFKRNLIMKFATAAAQRLHTDKQCRHVIKLLPIINHNAIRPQNFHKIVEIAFTGFHKNDSHRPMYRDEIISWSMKNFNGCDVKVSFDCPKCMQPHATSTCACREDGVIIKVDDDWIRANAEVRYWSNPRYLGTYGLNKPDGVNSFYHPTFSLIRPAQHKFFNADYHVKGCINLNSKLLANCPIEYMLENDRFRINSETGTILLSYLEIMTDEAGFPLVPDDVDVFEAIFWDVEYKMLYRQKRKHKENYQLSMNAKQLADLHMRRAIEKFESMSQLEWMRMIQNLMKGIPYRNADVQANRVLEDRLDSLTRRHM